MCTSVFTQTHTHRWANIHTKKLKYFKFQRHYGYLAVRMKICLALFGDKKMLWCLCVSWPIWMISMKFGSKVMTLVVIPVLFFLNSYFQWYQHSGYKYSWIGVMLLQISIGMYSKLVHSSADSSNVGLIIHVKIKVHNYLLNAENSIICGLPNTL